MASSGVVKPSGPSLSFALRASGYALLGAHLAGMYFAGFSILGATTRTWLFTILGTLAIPFVAWDVARRVDQAIGRVVPGRVRSGLARGVVALLLLALSPALFAAVSAAPLPVIGRVVEMSTALLSVGVAVSLVLGGLGVADVLYATTRRLRSLSTRLMVLLLFASLGSFFWLGTLGLWAKSVLAWAIEQGHLEAYVVAISEVQAFVDAYGGSLVGGVAGIVGLELPFTLLLAWRFGKNATSGLGVLAEGFERVAAGDLDQPVDVTGNDEVADMQRGFNRMLEDARERRLLETAFGRYVSPVVLDRVRQRGGRMLSPERRVATVLFSDLRGFTAMSAELAPEEIIALLNAYMSRMIETIARYDGYINKFVGDAILVVFGAPLEQPDHALRALACAKAMQAELRRANDDGAFGAQRLEMGIGINTGPLVLGNLGNRRQVEFTVLGDTVNVASRVCGVAEAWTVLTTGAVLAEARAHSGGEVVAECIGPKELKGKGPTELFCVRSLAPGSDASPDEATAPIVALEHP